MRGKMKGHALQMWLSVFVLALLVWTPKEAQAQYGKITGTITDALTGEALPGVNVIIDGTTQGTATDLDGEYFIVGVRPGSYTLVISYIGFETVRVQDVRVQIDLTTEIDVQLKEEVIEGQEVVVVAERPLVQKDLTATTAVVTGEKIRSLPLENFSDVVNLQAGVVNGHFRGGRTGEVAYLVDGLPVTDVFDGSVGVSIENEMVEEAQVVTGAFNAEYGQALSGIVNVVTRDGSNQFSGRFAGFMGDYASNHTTLFPEINKFNPTAVANGELSLGGPILKDRLFFFTSGRYFKNDGWVFGRNQFTYNDVGFDTSGRLALLNENGSGDSSVVALNPYDKISGQAKLTYRLTSKIRVAGNIIASQENLRSGGHNLFFFPAAQLDQERTGRSIYFKWTHTLSNRSFYEAGVTNSYSTFQEHLFDDPFDERYRDPTIFNQFSDPLLTSGFKVGGTDNKRFFRSTNTYLFKADFTSQVDDINLLKVGAEFRRHELTFKDDFVVVNEDTGERFVSSNGRYVNSPIEFSAYVQDKVELGGLIINAGIRFDYFDSKGRVLIDPSSKEALFLENRLADLDPSQIDLDEGGFPIIDYTPDTHFKDADPQWQISPRIGVAFPISESGVIHFSYGHFFQIPNFFNLYQNPFFQLGSSGSGLIGLVGNANLEPEQTINGEIGLKQQLSAASAIEVTAYYRDIRNLTGTATDPIQISGTSARYGMLVNSDFGFVRGIVFRFDQRVGGSFFASADYTYQVAKANASDPSQIYNAAATKQELEKQILPTNWDQRHTANITFSYRQGQSWGFGLVGQFGTGEPFTPQQTTKQTGAIIPTIIPLNSERKPITANIDLDFYKNINVGSRGSLQVYGRVDNLLDTKNEYQVFGDTGRATYSLQKNVDEATFRGNPVYLDRWYTRPYFFSQPRRVVLGVRYLF